MTAIVYSHVSPAAVHISNTTFFASPSIQSQASELIIRTCESIVIFTIYLVAFTGGILTVSISEKIFSYISCQTLPGHHRLTLVLAFGGLISDAYMSYIYKHLP